MASNLIKVSCKVIPDEFCFHYVFRVYIIHFTCLISSEFYHLEQNFVVRVLTCDHPVFPLVTFWNKIKHLKRCTPYLKFSFIVILTFTRKLCCIVFNAGCLRFNIKFYLLTGTGNLEFFLVDIKTQLYVNGCM